MRGGWIERDKVVAKPGNRDRVRGSSWRVGCRGAWRVARRSNVAVRGLCGAIDRSVRGAIAVSYRSNVALRGLSQTRQNLAVGGLCGLPCFRPSFRIVLADVCGPECRQTSLCAVFAKIVFAPTRNAKSNTTNRHLSHDMLYLIILKNTSSRLRETLL